MDADRLGAEWQAEQARRDEDDYLAVDDLQTTLGYVLEGDTNRLCVFAAAARLLGVARERDGKSSVRDAAVRPEDLKLLGVTKA